MTSQLPVLVIGGTGMLWPAVCNLLDRGNDVVLVARRPERAGTHPNLQPVSADWANPAELADKVRLASNGASPTHVILWVHTPYAGRLHAALDGVLSPSAVVVHLCGSSGGDPRGASTPQPYGPPRHYRQVVLGFEGPPRGLTRWLTDQEISDGALKAMESTEPVQIVGRLDPWDEHP